MLELYFNIFLIFIYIASILMSNSVDRVLILQCK